MEPVGPGHASGRHAPQGTLAVVQPKSVKGVLLPHSFMFLLTCGGHAARSGYPTLRVIELAISYIRVRVYALITCTCAMRSLIGFMLWGFSCHLDNLF